MRGVRHVVRHLACILLLAGPLAGPATAGALAAEREAGPPPAPAAPSPAPPEAPAAPDPHAGLPPALAGAVAELEALCRKEGGTPGWSTGALVSEVSLSPDGRPDYVIDTRGIRCEGADSPWMGSDGARYMIYVSTGPDRWVRAFDRSARALNVTGGPKPELVLLSHAASCKAPNPKHYQRCTETYVWRKGKLRKIDEEWFDD